jgi:hypothetical protein
LLDCSSAIKAIVTSIIIHSLLISVNYPHRFQILRELIPHSDQKRDKASFLLEVFLFSLVCMHLLWFVVEGCRVVDLVMLILLTFE